MKYVSFAVIPMSWLISSALSVSKVRRCIIFIRYFLSSVLFCDSLTRELISLLLHCCFICIVLIKTVQVALRLYQGVLIKKMVSITLFQTQLFVRVYSCMLKFSSFLIACVLTIVTITSNI